VPCWGSCVNEKKTLRDNEIEEIKRLNDTNEYNPDFGSAVSKTGILMNCLQFHMPTVHVTWAQLNVVSMGHNRS